MTPAQLENAINSYNTGGAQPPAPAPAQAQPPAAPEQQTGSSKLKEFTEEVMRNAPGLSRYAPPRSSGGVEAFGRAAEKSVLPTAVGAGAAGLTSKAIGSTAARFIGKGLEVAPNPLIKAAGYGLEYGAPLVAGMGFGSGAHVLQEKALQANPEAAKALGVDEEKMQALQEQYPLASFAGSFAPGFALGTPPIKELRQLGAIGRARPDLAPYTSQMQSYIRKQAGVMGGIQSGINFGQQLWDADGDLSKVDIGQVGLAGAAGLLQSSPTRLGHAVFGTEPVDLRSKAKTEQTFHDRYEPFVEPEAPPAGTPRLEGPGEEAGAPPPRRPTPTAPPETNPDADLMNILGMTPKTAPPPAISAENQPYFTTSSGSAYYLNDEGTGTIRQRSPSEAKDDVGLSHFDTQPTSSRTVYLSQQGKEALAPWSSGDFDVRFNPQKKQAYLVYNNGPRQGQIATGTTVPYETEPKVGLYPAEHFDYEGYEPDFMHFGNVITQVNPQQPKPPEAVTPKPPEAVTPKPPEAVTPKPPEAPKTITALPNRNTLTPDASEDSILQFLAKHTKGLSKEEAIKQGIDPDVFRPYRDNPASVGLKSAFKKDGMSFDQAAQILSEQGYPVTDENGNYSPNVLLDHILDELRGNPKHSDSNTRWAQEQEFNYLTKQYPDAKIVKPKSVNPKIGAKSKNVPVKITPAKTIGQAVTDAADNLVQNGGTAADAVSTAIADTNLGIVKETIAAKPGMNIERMANMLGPQLYGDQKEQAYVTIKELLQNSFDAVKALLDSKAIAKGRIDIRFNAPDRSISLIDNGSGMTPDILATKFLEIAGTHKESDTASGGFGIAKMLTLYANEDIHVTTMRDGKVAVLDTSGKQLIGALSSTNAKPPPSIEVRKPTLEDLAMFPDGHGTHVRITVPKSFSDTSTGKDTEIKFPESWQGAPDAISRSPLFADIDVQLNGVPVDKVGSYFPASEYSQFAKVEYPWGTARIYVSKDPRPEHEKYRSNTNVLSNGLFQFSTNLTKDPTNPYGDAIPYNFYVDLRPSVKPGEAGYPFTFNRKAFTEQASSDVKKVLDYINKQYSYKDFSEEAKSFGGIQYFDNKGRLGSVKKIEPKIAAPKSKFDNIYAGANVKVKNGIIYVDGKEIPALTPDDLKADIPDAGKLKVDQKDIDSALVMVHDNLTITTPDGPMEVSDFLRGKFGDRYDKYIYGIGKQFDALRDLVTEVMGYYDLTHEGIGISIDQEYRGVSTRVPFSASFINPLIPEAFHTGDSYIKPTNNPVEAAYNFVGTMIHELAHHKERSHNASFPAEMQRIESRLQANESTEYDAIKKAVLKLVQDNVDIIKEGTRIYEHESIAPTRKRLQDNAELIRPEGRDEGVSSGDSERSGAVGTGEQVLRSDQASREAAGLGREAGAGSGENETAGALRPQYERLRPEPEEPEAVPGSTEARMQDAEAKIKERARSLTGELDKTPIKDRIKEVRENVDKYLDKLKEGYQNVFWPSEKIQRGIELRPGNHLIISGQDANNLYMKQATMDDRASMLMKTEIDPLINKLAPAMLDYATSKNLPPNVAVQTIGDYLKARHADERRNVFFMLYRPLKAEAVPGAAGSETGMAPYKIRQRLLAKAAEILADNKTPYDAKRSALKKISDQIYRVVSDNRNADPFGISPQRKARGYYGEKDQPLAMPTNWSAELYAPAYDTTPAEMASIRMLMQRDLADPAIGPKLQKLLDLHDKELLPLHRKLNKQSGSWAENTDLIVDGFYGFENYAALKAKAGESDLVDLEGTRNLGDVAGLTYGMEGGRHTIENPLLQLISDTYRAARKASREGITLRTKNLIDQGYLAGEHVADIPASEQFFNNDILDKYPQAKNSKSIFHKLPNGDIQVYHVNNEGVLNGLRRPFDELSTYEKVIKYMTNSMAQQYTRFRLAFHPLNFVNDTLYNSTVLPSRYEGSIDKLDYLSEVFKNAVRGNGFKGLKYARYYRTDFNKLKEAARTDPYARDILEWMNEGGSALYGQVLNIDTAYKKFSKLSSGPVARTAYKSWEAVDAGLDYWAKSWDFLSRVTAYSMMKKVEYRRVYDREIAAGKSETEARVIAESEAREIAAYQAKQLGNFSLYGSKRYLPIRFMFFRPGATTLAKTLELLAPAWRSEESQLQNFLPEAAKLKPEEVSHAREKIRKAKNIALGMIRAFFGYGMAFYAMNYLLGMMLPGDEQGRNRVANDDKSQSVRGFRVPLPWDKKHFVNAPLSFGPLNIINMGYQTASFLNPADSNFMNVDGYTGNMLRIASNMFSPIQPSAINPTKYPVQFLSDTLLPSVAKPVGQLAMNMTSFGSQIYNDTPGRISDVYTGGQTVPQIYKDLSNAGYKAFETEIPPSMIRFGFTNYLNGVADMASMGDEIIRGIMKAAGSPQGKTPDAKVFVGSIIGNRASTDTANYTAVNDKIAAIKRDIATAEATGDPQLIIRATKKHAMDKNAITAFNANLGKMRGIQKRMKELRANQIMPLEAKSKLLDALQSQLELEKRLAVDSVKPFGIKP
jgi:hypothetical protein